MCSTLRSTCQDRSERTRQRLIEVAVEVFSELGYEGASTRAIVKQAQANLVSIPYYFGSKLGLYHAAAEYIGSNIAERFAPACEQARLALQQKGLTHQETLRNFTELIVEFAGIMLGTDTPRSWGQFIYREQFDPTGAFEILHTKFLPLLEVGFEYVSRLTRPSGRCSRNPHPVHGHPCHGEVSPRGSRLGAAQHRMEVVWRGGVGHRHRDAAPQHAGTVRPSELARSSQVRHSIPDLPSGRPLTATGHQIA